MRAPIRGLRLLIVPAIWLAFVPYAIAAGRNPGFVPPSYAGPYPTGHVIAVCLLLAIESLVFSVMLQPLTYELRDWRRPLKVLAICLLALFLEFLFMYTDMPGYVYVNAAFLLAWCLVTFSLVVVGFVISKVSPSATSNSSKHAA